MSHAATAGGVNAQNPETTFAALRRTRPIKFLLMFLLIGGVWLFARFGSGFGADGTGSFAQPEAFVATPGEGARHIHIRAGPGAEFKIREDLDRGTTVSGVARRMDTTNQPWIELADGRGFAKESVLAPPATLQAGQ